MKTELTSTMLSLFNSAPKFILIYFVFFQGQLLAQDSLTSSAINKKRLRAFVIGSSTAYTVTQAGLYQLWYKDSKRQSFKFFNDNAEWKQVDKLGHFFSGFYLSLTTHRALQWSGVAERKSALISSLTGFAILLPVEVFDGFSDAYGASTGDLIANGVGSALFLAQQLHWKEVRVYPKFSFHHTGYARLRPKLLGDNSVSEILKDYNGQTYWLSIDADKFIQFPKWLNLAIGYGAEEMISARDEQNIALGYDPHRQWYISFDIDLTAIRTKSKFLKSLIYVANMIKIPAPAMRFSTKGTRFYALYY